MKQKTIEKECKHHGLTNFILQNRSKHGAYRCKLCMQQAVTNRRRKVKQMAVEYKGNQCKLCGYKRCITALEFHHLDPSTKSFNIGGGETISWERVKAELDKCILVCSNCHREIECGFIQAPERGIEPQSFG